MPNAAAVVQGFQQALGKGDYAAARKLLHDRFSFQGPIDTFDRPDPLDIRLPTTSGLALYLLIKNRWPRLAGRMAIMTGDAEAEEIRAWIAANPCTVLRKPFDLRRIFEWVMSVVGEGEHGDSEAAR
jgi:CheY-like chemotaxis protein